jgi:beta-lactamase superfamily II metal-dependent hydrolase
MAAAGLIVFVTTLAFGSSSTDVLEIHYINVGQGGSTLIVGPNGTRILYDFGWKNGDKSIVPYLRDTIKLKPQEGLHYSIVSHRDSDHYSGYKAVIKAGYDVLVANYGAGSPKSETEAIRRQWLRPAKQTTAGSVRPIPVGLRISLGDGAEAVVMAANGKIYGRDKAIKVTNENDRSVALFIQYGKFQFILDGDLGAGPAPDGCETGRETTQQNLQVPVAQALLQMGLMRAEVGVDVFHVAHHGSESSTSAEYYNLIRPLVGIISVGLNQGNFRHPRKNVVEKVLQGSNRAACVTAPSLELLLQTEDGIEGDCEHCGSNIGLSFGDIHIITDGRKEYRIYGTNCVFGGNKEAPEGKIWVCSFDEDGPHSVSDPHSTITPMGFCKLIPSSEDSVGKCTDSRAKP